MEIIYCAECGKMIPPGGVDEGKRYLKDGEPICPKCYRKLPEGEHSGKTIVVSESIMEQLASEEPSEPDYGPKPKTSKLLIPAGRRRRPGSGGHPVVGEGAGGSGRGLIWAAVAVVLVFGLTAGLALTRDRGETPHNTAGAEPRDRPPIEPPAGPPVEPPTEPQPNGDEDEHRAAFETAEKFRKDNPQDYAGALALFEKLRKDAEGSDWAGKAAQAVEQVEGARNAEAEKVLKRLAEEASKLEAAGDFDGALKLYAKPEERLASVLSPRFRTAGAAVMARAEARLGEITGAAERLSARGKPEEALLELKAADGLKYAAGAPKVAEFRGKFEKQKVELATRLRRERETRARDLRDSALARFEKLVLRGDCDGAELKLKEDRRGIDTDLAKLVGGQLDAAEKLARALTGAVRQKDSDLQKLTGRELELSKKDGETCKGSVTAVRGQALVLKVVSRSPQGEIIAQERVRFIDMAPGQLRALLPAGKPTGADEHLLAAIKLMSPAWGTPSPQNLKKAGEMLAASGGHPLRARWELRLAMLLGGEKETAAEASWEEEVEKRLRRKYTPGEARSLLAALDAFVAAHGATKFAEGKADEIAKLRREAGEESLDLAAGVRKLFKGDVVRFDPKTLEVELAYDFSDAKQLEDFAGPREVKVAGGRLEISNANIKTVFAFEGGCRVRCRASLGKDHDFRCILAGADLRAGLLCKLGAGKVELYDWAGKRPGSGLGLAALPAQPAGGLHLLELTLAGGEMSAKAGGRSLGKPLKTGAQSVGVAFEVHKPAVVDDLRIAGRLDRAWLNKALRRAGLPSLRSPAPTAGVEIIIDDKSPGATRKGAWRTSTPPGAYMGSAVYGLQNESFRWTPDLPSAGTYRVYAWWTVHYSQTEEAKYTVVHSGKSSPVTVSQKKDGRRWKLLGEFAFEAGRGGYVELSAKQGKVVADAVRFVRLAPGAGRGPGPVKAGIGLRGEFFNGTNFETLVRARLDTRVSYHWAGVPESGVDANRFSVRWTGFVRPPATGEYTFHTTTDDGARLWVNGEQLVDDWKGHRETEACGKIELQAGKRYPIRLEYFDRVSTAIVKLSWSGPGIKDKQIVGTRYLFPPARWLPASPWSGSWQKAPGTPPHIGGHQATAFDALKGRLFVVNEKFRVLSYNRSSGEWTQLSAAAAGDGSDFPRRVGDFNAVYIPARDGLLVCGGGYDGKEGGTSFYDVKASKWKCLVRENVKHPALAVGRNMVVRLYTKPRGTDFLFERFDFPKGEWVKVDGKLPPFRRYPGDVLVFDSAQASFLLWGGARFTDTWICKAAGNGWRELRAAANPSIHQRPAVCYDRRNQLFVMHGGWQGASRVKDTWVFDAGRKCWFEVKEDTAPHGGVDGLEYDPLTRCCIGWKARDKEVWTLRITPAR